MTVDRFIPNAQPSTQPQGRDRAPPSPAAYHPKKKQKVGEQPPKVLGDVPVKTPPQGGITIRELKGDPQPPAKGRKDLASSSQSMDIWQPTFKFGEGLLPASASIKAWAQGQGGRVAESLVHDLLLLEDIHFFSDGIEDSLVWRLQWHTVAVIFLPFIFLFFLMHE